MENLKVAVIDNGTGFTKVTIYWLNIIFRWELLAIQIRLFKCPQ